MGLAIGYRLQCNDPCTNAARRIVAQFHKKATQLPVLELGGVIERMGAQTNPDHEDPRTPISWVLYQACLYIEEGADCHQVPPSHLVAFSVWVEEGAEVMNLGLAKYPETIQAPDGRLLPTNTQGLAMERMGERSPLGLPVE